EKNAVAKDVRAYILQVSQYFNKFCYGHLQWHAIWVLIRQINIGISFTHIYSLFIIKIPLPKFPPIVIALIPNHGSDKADDIAKLHFKLLDDIAPRLELHLLSFG